jgi:hypothetical protein
MEKQRETAQKCHAEELSPPSKKRYRSEEDHTDHAVYVSNILWDCDGLALAACLSKNLQQFGILDFSGDPTVKFLHYKEQGIAYVELRCKEELRKLLQLNRVVLFYGIQLRLAAWNFNRNAP